MYVFRGFFGLGSGKKGPRGVGFCVGFWAGFFGWFSGVFLKEH